MKSFLKLKIKSENGLEWKSKGSLKDIEKDFQEFLNKKK